MSEQNTSWVADLRTWAKEKLDRDWSSVILKSLLWGAGPVLSYLFLPIEGEFWNSLMPDGNRFRAYAGCFVLDITGSVLIYFFSRIQQTERAAYKGKDGKRRKGSKRWQASWGILGFAGAGVLSSWFVSFQQMCSLNPDVYSRIHVLNAAIQPVIQLGIGYTQAVLGGKFDVPASEQPVVKVVQQVSKKRKGAPTIDWWRSTYGQLNGERGQMTAERVQEMVQAEWEDSISRTTAYNWRDECVEKAAEVN